MTGGGYILRPEFDRLEEDVDWTRGRVIAHDATLATIVNKLSSIETDLRELAVWKDDSKVQEIRVLKGRIKKTDGLRDRVIYVLLTGAALEAIRLLVERWFGH